MAKTIVNPLSSATPGSEMEGPVERAPIDIVMSTIQ